MRMRGVKCRFVKKENFNGRRKVSFQGFILGIKITLRINPRPRNVFLWFCFELTFGTVWVRNVFCVVFTELCVHKKLILPKSLVAVKTTEMPDFLERATLQKKHLILRFLISTQHQTHAIQSYNNGFKFQELLYDFSERQDSSFSTPLLLW